ncbi:MAG: universal stress protein [Ilumatobacteraceae bacterium]
MSNHIVVGFDGSESSHSAVMWAAAEADVRGVVLHIVSCYELPIGGEASIGWSATAVCSVLLDDAERRVIEIRSIVSARYPALEITTDVSAGPADIVLVDGVGIDNLVVVGASRHEGNAAFWLGTTARYAVRHSQAPVVVVRGAATDNPPTRIVVGIDGSPESLEALQWAGAEADLHGVNLVVVHSWSYPYLPVDAGASQARDLTKVDAACVLDQALEVARERFAAGVEGLLVEDSAPSALLATVHDGDLLVLGSRGRGAVRARLFGSTVNSVLDEAVIPVVVIPHHVAK